jgi:large subunit ribosomal protein L9
MTTRYQAVKIILIEEIPSLGTLGSVVEVAPGYGRNYLIPQGKALEATKGNLARFEQQRSRLMQQYAKEKDSAQALADRLGEITLTIPQRVGESDRLYGSVTNVHIAEALAKKGLDIDRKKIDMPEPIKTVGTHEAVIKLHTDVKAVIKIEVVPERA